MPLPYQIVAGPFEVYVAPVGESFPSIDTSPPGGNWTLLGTNGSEEYNEDGVTVAHEETIEDFRMLGATGAVKSNRTSEGLAIRFTLHDLTLEQYAAALNFNTVTTTAAGAGTQGYREIPTYKGFVVAQKAVLVRGVGLSPYGDTYNMDFQIPRARVASQPEVVFRKDQPAGLSIEFMALIDLNAATEAERFGKIVAADTDAA